MSQIRWRMPPSMWWIRDHVNKNSSSLPMMLEKKWSTVA